MMWSPLKQNHVWNKMIIKAKDGVIGCLVSLINQNVMVNDDRIICKAMYQLIMEFYKNMYCTYAFISKIVYA